MGWEIGVLLKSSLGGFDATQTGWEPLYCLTGMHKVLGDLLFSVYRRWLWKWGLETWEGLHQVDSGDAAFQAKGEGGLQSAWRLVSAQWFMHNGVGTRLLRNKARRMDLDELWNEYTCILQKNKQKKPKSLYSQDLCWSSLTFHYKLIQMTEVWLPCSVSPGLALIFLRSRAGVYSPSSTVYTHCPWNCLSWAVVPLRTASCLVWYLLSLPFFLVVCSCRNMQYLKFGGDQFFILSLVGWRIFQTPLETKELREVLKKLGK